MCWSLLVQVTYAEMADMDGHSVFEDADVIVSISTWKWAMRPSSSILSAGRRPACKIRIQLWIREIYGYVYSLPVVRIAIPSKWIAWLLSTSDAWRCIEGRQGPFRKPQQIVKIDWASSEAHALSLGSTASLPRHWMGSCTSRTRNNKASWR